MFAEIFGNSPQVKVLDFLLDHKDYDYTMSDIAEGAEIARPTLYSIWDSISSLGIVVPTRKIGNAQLYRLHKEGLMVKKLIAFDFELSKIIAHKFVSLDKNKIPVVKPYAHISTKKVKAIPA